MTQSTHDNTSRSIIITALILVPAVFQDNITCAFYDKSSHADTRLDSWHLKKNYYARNRHQKNHHQKVFRPKPMVTYQQIDQQLLTMLTDTIPCVPHCLLKLITGYTITYSNGGYIPYYPTSPTTSTIPENLPSSNIHTFHTFDITSDSLLSIRECRLTPNNSPQCGCIELPKDWHPQEIIDATHPEGRANNLQLSLTTSLELTIPFKLAPKVSLNTIATLYKLLTARTTLFEAQSKIINHGRAASPFYMLPITRHNMSRAVENTGWYLAQCQSQLPENRFSYLDPIYGKYADKIVRKFLVKLSYMKKLQHDDRDRTPLFWAGKLTILPVFDCQK